MSIRKGNDIIASKPLVDAVPTQDSTNAVSSGGVYDALATKQDTISDLATIRSGAAAGATAVQPSDLATVATTGNYNDLTNKPTIPAAQVNSDWDAVSGVAQILNKPTLGTAAAANTTDFATAAQGTLADTAVQPGDLATVATSGDYDDLQNKPTLGTAAAANTTDFATAAQGALADTAVQPGDLATVATTGEFSDLQNKPTTLSGYGITDGANTNLSNLTNTGANIGNWSHNVTNYITEIPQDIKLELNAGTLTLKAGSKCYLKTDTTTPSVNVASDLTTTQTTNGTYFAIYNGSALTTVLTTTYNYSTLPSTYSLPLAVITVSNGAISSINQVFNGFGYVGSTIFALPGVKGLIPDGRNSDGTLKNTAIAPNSVITRTFTSAYSGNYDFFIDNNSFGGLKNTYTYDEINNRNKDGSNNFNLVYIGTAKLTSGVVNQFNPKTAFHAVDYSDTEFIAHQAMPSDRYVDLTKPTQTTNYTAPADGYVFVAGTLQTSSYCGLFDRSGFMGSVANAHSSNQYFRLFLPVSKGNTYTIELSGTLSLDFHRFKYANGAS